ncbi:hypothetical protein FUAX_08020 [Fulvitalea axinellae]|uniref:Uncharacterized protein n=1 Tax=Fulvitalea axinellae TaxID=1182444 RepID=A0AAU9D818_9BACT|nr:hypothetical protein FUAX_08020 [Fulvitalea axinellae]
MDSFRSIVTENSTFLNIALIHESSTIQKEKGPPK